MFFFHFFAAHFIQTQHLACYPILSHPSTASAFHRPFPFRFIRSGDSTLALRHNNPNRHAPRLFLLHFYPGLPFPLTSRPAIHSACWATSLLHSSLLPNHYSLFIRSCWRSENRVVSNVVDQLTLAVRNSSPDLHGTNNTNMVRQYRSRSPLSLRGKTLPK